MGKFFPLVLQGGSPIWLQPLGCFMKYDIAIIGSGPGGYVAAIRCSQLGMKTAIIERYPALGGTCLNAGCIPSKALLDSSEHYYNALTNFKTHGITVEGLKVSLSRMMKRKDELVSKTCEGIKSLMSKNKVDTFHGQGSFLNPHTIEITVSDGSNKRIEAGKTIIATGSKPSSIPNVVIDKKKIITSTEALSLKKIPLQMIIIGGGAIGLELGSVFARMGTNIKIIEFMDSIICSMDRTLGKELEKSLKKIGMEFYLGHKVKSAVVNSHNKVTVTTQNKREEEIKFTGDYCLVAVGRKPCIEKLELKNARVAVNEKEYIIVNDNLETSNPNIYAIGDVIGGAMLAHKASEEGIFVAEKIAGQKPDINYMAIPGVVYTSPEVAGVGYTEERLKSTDIDYKTGMFPLKALGRARASNETDGFVKVLVDKNSDEILGVHIIGARATDLIAEAVTALEFRASAEDIARISHAHPTYAEAFKEACLAATGNRAIHI